MSLNGLFAAWIDRISHGIEGLVILMVCSATMQRMLENLRMFYVLRRDAVALSCTSHLTKRECTLGGYE
jgi:hypothetical protein